MEPRYAGIADTMLAGGGWLVPRYEGTWYDQKPPLFFWTVAASLHLAGDARDLFLLRLPSAVGALLALIGTWLLGLTLWNGRTGLVAAAICTLGVIPPLFSLFARSGVSPEAARNAKLISGAEVKS